MMIKKVFALFMVIVLCLSMCACKKGGDEQTDPTTSGSTENTEASKATENTKATEHAETTESTEPPETTEPTEPPVVELSVSDWQLEERNYLSYEEYFSTQREFSVSLWSGNPNSWIKGDQVYSFGYEKFLSESSKCLVVKCYDINGVYVVPNSDAFVNRNYAIAGADGRYGYLYRYDEYRNYDQFLRMDLATGKTEVLLDGIYSLDYTMSGYNTMYLLDNLVLYYVSHVDNGIIIGRLYLPTLKNEILYKMQGEFYGFRLHRPETNNEIVWELWNPEYIDFLKAELANPNSTFQKNDYHYYDYSEIWKREDALAYILDYPMYIDKLENAGNQQAQLKCTYNIDSGELTRQLGIMDGCYYGSGYPHDHYNPDITTAPEPELIMSDWTKIAQEIPFPLCPAADGETVSGKIEKITDVDSQIYLYGKTDGDYKQIADTPIKIVVDTGVCAVYVSADRKSVVAVSYDGTQSVELYRAVHGEILESKLSYVKEDTVTIQDGDTLVEIDLSAGCYRELVKHPYIHFYYMDIGFRDGESFDKDAVVIYFETSVGMYFDAFLINMETGVMRSTGYRL